MKPEKVSIVCKGSELNAPLLKRKFVLWREFHNPIEINIKQALEASDEFSVPMPALGVSIDTARAMVEGVNLPTLDAVDMSSGLLQYPKRLREQVATLQERVRQYEKALDHAKAELEETFEAIERQKIRRQKLFGE